MLFRSTTQSVKAGWQEGNTTAQNNRPGYGTIITDSALDFSTKGFDFRSVGGPSMKYYSNNAVQGYLPVPRTDVSNGLKNAAGYMIYIRGDRSCLPTNSTTASTILRASGQVYNGTQTFTITDTSFMSFGNPYPSAVEIGRAHV